jgi:carboxymethylenebutenolidase
MTELQRYLAEEVAEDHADGIITRREAMRRLGLLGVTGAAASSMLATVGAAPAAAAHGGSRTRGGRFTEWAPVATQEITFPGPRTPLMAAWAPAAKPKGGLLVIHENRGLNNHIRQVAGRYAAVGYSALALDLLSEEGGTGSFPDEAAVAAALSAIAGRSPERFTDDMKAALTELQRRVRGERLAAIGYCFGGGMVWQLLASGEPRLSAAAPYYGPFPTGGDVRGSRKAAVLGVYAGLDTRVNASRDAAQAALEAARLRHEILTFTQADHAFFNDTGARFNAPAAAEAWRRTVAWFDEFVAGHGNGRGGDSDSD